MLFKLPLATQNDLTCHIRTTLLKFDKCGKRLGNGCSSHKLQKKNQKCLFAQFKKKKKCFSVCVCACMSLVHVSEECHLRVCRALQLGHQAIIITLLVICQRHEGHAGRCKDELLLLTIPFHVAPNIMCSPQRYTIHFTAVSQESVTPSGVSNIVHTTTTPQKVYIPKAWLVFQPKIWILATFSTTQ